MAQRTAASDAGEWAGVAFTSAFPCRSLSTPWPPDVYETGRLQFGSFFTTSAWVTGAVLYGYPEGRNHPNAHAQTEALLDFAVSHLMSFPGPKFIGGDWNFQLPDLAVVPLLRARGWVEVQELYHTMTGAPIQNTCRGATRKDFLWISPELAMVLSEVHVCHETFADHAVIIAKFRGGSHHLDSFVWPCPKPVPWGDAHALPDCLSFALPADPTAQYAKMWQLKEQAAAATVTEWIPAMGGRGQKLRPIKRRPSSRDASQMSNRGFMDFLPCMSNSSGSSAACRTTAVGFLRLKPPAPGIAFMELDFGMQFSKHLVLCPTSGAGGTGDSMSANLILWTCLGMRPTLRLLTRFLRLCLQKSGRSSAT